MITIWITNQSKLPIYRKRLIHLLLLHHYPNSFDTQLLISESRGKIAHDFRVFFMGHKGSIEAKYTTNKSILSKLLTDEMREAFRKSQEFLDLEVTAKKEENVSTEKIVTVQEFEKLISEGWQYVATLPNDKILVKNSRARSHM
ncbi:MAG: hypothetical protein ACYC6W_03165 [Nitrosotalea sp.]